MSFWEFTDVLGNSTTDHVCYNYFAFRLWMLYSLLPAVAILTLFCFLEQRVNLWTSCCQGRPGVAFPVNLVDSYTDRFSFAFAFGSMSTSMATAFYGNNNILLGAFDINVVATMLQGTVQIFLAVANALIISVVFYPILLCLSTKKPLVGNAIGLVYSCTWLVYYICSTALSCDELIIHPKRVIFNIIWQLGTHGSGTICFLALVIRFTLGIVKDIKLQLKEEDDVPQADFTMTHFYHRVEFLLRRPLPEDSSGSIFVRLFRRFIGTVPGFRFSRHNICTLVLTLVTTIQVTLLYMSLVGDLVGPDKQIAFWIACAVAIIVTLIFTTDMQLRYRKHTVKLWRGDWSFCSEDKGKFDTILVSSLRYSGYQVAYTAWAFLIMQVILWGISTVIIWRKDQVVTLIKMYWLTLIVMFVFYYGQVCITRLAFLQRAPDRGQSGLFRSRETYLGLDNRRVFHVTVYITLFVNFLVGIFSCFFRILKAIALETIFIGRLDRCILMRGWEHWDQGFRSYIGFLELEVAHTHPVLVTFCHFLLQNVYTRRGRGTHNELGSIIDAEGGYAEWERTHGKFMTPGELTAQVSSRRMHNKWLVALTLARNPQLASERKLALIEAQRKKRQSTISLNVGDSSVTGETDA